MGETRRWGIEGWRYAWVTWAIVACAKAPEPEPTPAGATVTAPRGASNPILAAPPAAPAEPPPPAPVAVPEAKKNTPSETDAAGEDTVWTDDTVLKVYREVYCARKGGSEASVQAVWTRHGIDGESWARAIQGVAEKAAADPEGFGKRWAAISAEPCP